MATRCMIGQDFEFDKIFSHGGIGMFYDPLFDLIKQIKTLLFVKLQFLLCMVLVFCLSFKDSNYKMAYDHLSSYFFYLSYCNYKIVRSLV